MEIPKEFYLQVPSSTQLYARAIREIAEKAPVRLLPEEKLAGASTLRDALGHIVSVSGVRSVSHTTIGFEKALKVGLNGLRREIRERLKRGGLDVDGTDLLNSMLECLGCFEIWKNRYVQEARALGLDEVAQYMQAVPENPPQNFREAVQALWLLWDFQRLCGNWSGIGRIDKMLGPFLKADLARGAITLDGARELLAHFWIKGCEWIGAGHWASGDAQFYQNIVLAGVDEEGHEVTNEVTHLVLDIVEELHISDFPIAVRLSKNSDEKLMRRVAQVQKLGGGIVAVYNEDRVISNLITFGYPDHEARNFANDGCWEALIPGKTAFSYQPFDALYLLQDTLCLNNEEDQIPEYKTFDELYHDFLLRLARKLADNINLPPYPSRSAATVLVDLFVEGCIESGRSYYDRGAKYSVFSPHPGGLQDVANSLLSIKKLVYDEMAFSLPELVTILRQDWDGQETLRRRIRESGEFYGNDSAEADGMVQRVFEDYTGLVAKVPMRNGVLRPAGISTFGRESDAYLPDRTASAAGTRKADVLALNFSPAPGTDRKGPTAVIKSHCSVDFSKLPCGTALELKLSPSSLKGESGEATLVGLMKSFVALGGIFMQIDVVDSELLRKAQDHPEDFPNLAVRVSGWSARFATLNRKWQDMVIARTEQSL